MHMTSEQVQQISSHFFPAINNFGEPDFEGILRELNDFGIASTEQLNDLLQKHTAEVMQIDAESLDEEHIKWFRDENIPDLEDKIANNYWFNWTGLLRVALELEFGEAYRNYCFKRDGLED